MLKKDQEDEKENILNVKTAKVKYMRKLFL